MHNNRLKFNQILLKRLLFKQKCMLCAASEGGDLALCAACLADLPYHQASQCPQCALPSFNAQVCGHCLKLPPAFDATRALMRYEYPLDSMLQAFKYGEMLNMAASFASLMVSKLHQNQAIDLVIPMPLHQQRLKERGFNQSLEIAKMITQKTGHTLDAAACQRIKLSPPQASLPHKERVKNMRGAFNCQTQLTGLSVLLIDDVMTTGASLHALAETVKKAGATRVECWVVARTLAR